MLLLAPRRTKKTPMIEVTRMDTGPCRLFLKLESQNPGGSIKDRIALEMIEVAEREGWLKPGGTIVEATAGNTGLALTLVGKQKGYNILLVIPDKMSKEKIQHLRAMGADFEAAHRFRDPFANHWVVDGNLVTGQNQNAGPMVAREMMALVAAGAP